MLPQARSDLAAVVVGGKGYVLGGYTGSAFPAEVLVTRDGKMFRVQGALAVPVRYAAVAAIGSTVFVFGGLAADGRPVSTVQSYDTRTGHTRVAGHLPRAVAGATAVVVAGRVLVFGGRLADGAATPDVVSWKHGRAHRVARLKQPVANDAAVAIGPTVWILGGETGAGTELRTVQTITASAGTP